MTRLLFALAAVPGLLAGAEFRAGAARLPITPDEPVWLSGYAARNRPSEGVAHELYARALALDGGRGGRVVVVAADIIGLPRALSDEVAARAAKQYGLQRSELLLNFSHTHTGPVIWPNLAAMWDLPPGQEDVLRRYSRRLASSLVNVIGAALGRLEPAALSFGEGTAAFAANRRVLAPEGVKFGVNPEGPVDHSVPVIRVARPGGETLAVVFGYACHNTTMTGSHYRISGDYAGFAASGLEETFPGAVALFLSLCGADQNPEPRGEESHARTHGAALAAEVRRVLGNRLAPVRPPVRSAFQLTSLPLRPHSRDQFEKELDAAEPAVRNRARATLEAYGQRRAPRSVAYPVQAVRLGRDLTLVALGGEVVVDYALRAKREFPGERLVVAGYSNDVMCYIPSRRILQEGGYEAERSMVYYGQPAPFTSEVEETVFAAIRQVLGRVGVKAAR
jgi:hypothetical protein